MFVASTSGRDRDLVRGPLAAALVACVVAACGSASSGDDGNVLPTQANTEDSGSSAGPTTDSMTGAMTSMTTMTTTADTTDGDTGTIPGAPAAYRFECVDIQMLGDADDSVLQARLLEDTWSSDIDDYKLNILFEVASRDDVGMTAEVGIRSGVGSGPADMCAEATTQTDLIPIDFDPASTLWEPSVAEGECSAMAAGGATSGGSYTMTLSPDVLVYIYAQDTNGITFNCTADETPDAVPVRAVEAELTVSADGGSVAGRLTGCLLDSEAAVLCSCLGSCNAKAPNENCGGCPDGSVPLKGLLSGIGTSKRCSDLTGVDAYDLTIGFSGLALPSVPVTCGG